MENIPVRVTSNKETKSSSESNGRPRRKRRFGLIKSLILVIVIAAIATGAWLYGRSTSLGAQINGGEYQALFLTNGQVYFGKLQPLGNDYFQLSSIFYLQSTSSDSNNPQKTADSTSDNVNLIKLGSEVHGPEDKMIVSKQQVLFFENLKADGRVSASIDQYLKKQ